MAGQLIPFPQIFLKRANGESPPSLGCGAWAQNPRPAAAMYQIHGENLSVERENEADRRGAVTEAESQSQIA